ncbi:hypothetical protein BD65_1725 [Yersinia ruckeri]|uniref:DUF2500 domain-containing protein n=1 Tax=Yersinia ruckeri TaxID=29486 RepID=UPI0005AC87C1|nr:DUF2500 domain-containing protein [Yersinia ruckeri]AJI96367.1 hypothetical protein BD65_1725 [Yersinia ruckeri]MCW6569021.1 DUF2500 domain-containing protein [Yersinia ruckeri]
MNKPPLIFIVVVALIVILATRQYWQKRRQDAENDKLPVRSLQVEVSNKREILSPNRRSRQREEIVAEDKNYEVSFRSLLSGSELNIKLAREEYQRINPGTQGTLQLQGTRYIDFTPSQHSNSPKKD